MSDQQLIERNSEAKEQSLVKMGERGLELRSMNDAWRFASMVAQSGMAPKGMEQPQQIMIAIQMGAELGLAPMQALQNVAVINGRPSLWGDAMLALVEDSGLLVDFWEEFDGNGDNLVAVCYSHRKGRSRGKETRFGVQDAKKANLWGKSGPWSQYPKRMLQMRARSFNLRDNFPDVLRGLRIAEEAMDIPANEAPARVQDEPADADFTPASKADQLASKLKGQDAPAPEPAEAAPEGLFNGEATADTPLTEVDSGEQQSDSGEPAVTSGQATALSIALKAAGFKTTEEGKEQGRAFIAYLVGLESLESIKDLTKEQASGVLDMLGGEVDGEYRVDKPKLQAALEAWEEARAAQEVEGEFD